MFDKKLWTLLQNRKKKSEIKCWIKTLNFNVSNLFETRLLTVRNWAELDCSVKMHFTQRWNEVWRITNLFDLSTISWLEALCFKCKIRKWTSDMLTKCSFDTEAHHSKLKAQNTIAVKSMSVFLHWESKLITLHKPYFASKIYPYKTNFADHMLLCLDDLLLSVLIGRPPPLTHQPKGKRHRFITF